MARNQTCDNCGTLITDENPIIAKLYLAPFTPGKTRALHSLYTGHMDVGLCCKTKVVKGMKWIPRKRRVTR